MSAVTILSALMLLNANDPATADEARQTVERALPFLEKEGARWWETKKCVTCHQMPLMFRSLYEAQAQGFKIDQKLVDGLRHKVIERMTDKFPTGAKAKLVTDDSPILIWGLAAGGLDDKTRALLDKYVDLYINLQQADGSWLDPSLHWKETSSKVKDCDRGLDPYPPFIESDTVKTMYTFLAGQAVSKDKAAWIASRDKALARLKSKPAVMSLQERILRMVVAKESGQPHEALAFGKELVKQQCDDGGWRQAEGLSSDALATGQALYALHLADVTDLPAVQRAWGFLRKTQRTDGSWHVSTRNAGKPQASDTGDVTSYFGTAWAVLGLVRTSPKSQSSYVRPR